MGAAGLDSLSADERSLVESWRSAASVSSGVWPGLDLASIPTVLAKVDDDGVVEAAVAVNHPNPRALGDPTQSLDVDGHSIVVVGEVAAPDWLASRIPFDLLADIGGVDTFVVIAKEGRFLLEPGTPDFVATIVHEAFHRHEFEEWAPSATRQYFEDYDYSAANLELALLEDRILIAAYEAGNPDDLERLARQFAAVRTVRRQRDHRILHDEQQERSEGTARYIEHLIGDSIAIFYTSTNHTRDLHLHAQVLSDRDVTPGEVTRFFSRSRFFSTGAVLHWLLDRLEVPGVAQHLRDGKTPAVLLEERLAPLGDLDRLVAGARAEHDPHNRLGAAAATLAGLASTGPSNDEHEEQEETDDPEEAGNVVSDAERACLAANRIEVGPEPTVIPQDIVRKCLGSEGGAEDSPR